MDGLSSFSEIWAEDFEFSAPPGERQDPICYTARELRSGRKIGLFRDKLLNSTCPIPTSPDVLHVSYYSSAEAGCYRTSNWPLPQNTLDLFAEFRTLTNGLLPPKAEQNLFAVMSYFGLEAGEAAEKKEMQKALGLNKWQGVHTPEEIQNYCDNDGAALFRLLPAMEKYIDWPRALLRGKYVTVGVSAMEFHGVPIDTEKLAILQDNWSGIQNVLIDDVDKDFYVFEDYHLRERLVERYIIEEQGIVNWPRHPSGKLCFDKDTRAEMAKVYPQIEPLHELVKSIKEMRSIDLRVGQDGRNRTLLSPFHTLTGRNQPGSSWFIFALSSWLRRLIKPPPGYGIAYIDWAQQEPGIAAALSEDPAMMEAYLTGNIYLGFGKQIGMVPKDATKETHPHLHELFKAVWLGIIYGMGAETLGIRLGRSAGFSEKLLKAHRDMNRVFGNWQDGYIVKFLAEGMLHTAFGWQVRQGPQTDIPFLRNYPMQGNGSEMMRIAAILGTERGIEICAPVHDAFLIMAPIERLKEDIAKMRDAMAEASREVLNGFELRTDVESEACYPNHFECKKGKVLWDKVMRLLEQRGLLRRAA
jgi:hypothetical protein